MDGGPHKRWSVDWVSSRAVACLCSYHTRLCLRRLGRPCDPPATAFSWLWRLRKRDVNRAPNSSETDLGGVHPPSPSSFPSLESLFASHSHATSSLGVKDDLLLCSRGLCACFSTLELRTPRHHFQQRSWKMCSQPPCTSVVLPTVLSVLRTLTLYIAAPDQRGFYQSIDASPLGHTALFHHESGQRHTEEEGGAA